jgi:hypothetical protein
MGVLCALAAPVLCSAQIEDAEPRAEEDKVEIGKAEEEAPLFILNHVPPLARADGALDKLDELMPLKFGAESQFVSDWLDEGADAAKRGVQILQTYFTELNYSRGDASAGVGFSYFQVDTTGAYEGPSTLERDFTLYAPLAWKRFSITPSWTYIYMDSDDPDSGEIGTEFSIDMPLHPTFAWNCDYRALKGSYCEWDISQDFTIPLRGETLAIFTPSMAMGLDAHKAIECTHLTHLDWGLELGIPIMRHFIATGMLHFTKSLCRAQDEDGQRIFENIIPWAGLKLTAEF